MKLADIIVVIHFAWILFILSGFILTSCGFFWKALFDKWLFRTIHLCGIFYAGLLALLRKHCPLTVLENNLRQKYTPESIYPDSFIIHYIEKLVYPDLNTLMIIIPTVIIAVFTIVVFIVRPPAKIRKIFISSIK